MEYLIKVNLALLFSWALYRVAFLKLTFFQWNRFYLLGSVVLSLILPLLRLQLKSTMVAVVDAGVKVAEGQVIGKIDSSGQSTGPHLHYEVRLEGEHLNPADFY